jgi:formyltetrahydrofolate hydrolase
LHNQKGKNDDGPAAGVTAMKLENLSKAVELQRKREGLILSISTFTNTKELNVTVRSENPEAELEITLTRLDFTDEKLRTAILQRLRHRVDMLDKQLESLGIHIDDDERARA